ncbi:MAG: biotin/lipoyl-containing protein [Acidobacteriota bacterium]
MKLEIQHKNRYYQVEITEQPDGSFQICDVDPGGTSPAQPVRVLGRSADRWTLEIDGRIEDVLISNDGEETIIVWNQRTYPLHVYPRRDRVLRESSTLEVTGRATVRAEMPGKVISVLKSVGDRVKPGEGLIVIESMKMQNELKSSKAGTVITCGVEEGATVGAGDLLFEVE